LGAPPDNRVLAAHGTTGDGQVAQRSALTAGHKAILAALDLPEPPRFFNFTAAISS
jgi:hypothetical protein